MKKTLMIVFNLESGKNTTISIPDPREDLTNAEVVTAADEIVTKKAIGMGGVQVVSFKRAYVRTIEEKPLP